MVEEQLLVLFKTNPILEMKNIKILISILGILSIACNKPVVHQKINLSGEWLFAIDRRDKGISEKWYIQSLIDKVTLPGSMSTNGKGDDVSLGTQWTGQIRDSSYFKNPEYGKYREKGNIKIPFWLQPLKHYQGAAWYQKKITIPKNWEGQNIELFLERCHWESRLWIDGHEIGMQNSLCTPHIYDLTGVITFGDHILTLCIDNRIKEIDPGINSHSISDHTQTNWNGIIGQMFLEAHPVVYIQNIQVYPDVQNKKITAKIKIKNTSEQVSKITLNIVVSGAYELPSRLADFDLRAGENIFSIDYIMGSDVKLWSEFHPDLYTLKAVLTDLSSEVTNIYKTTFGMREFKVVGNQLTVNGDPIFLRGTLECAIFPETGYPPTTTSEWLRIFNICRAHGLNHMRFHSWCPPKAAFDAADQTGFYLQVECSSWANQSTTVGDGKPFDTYLYEESQRMVANLWQPSFFLHDGLRK